MADGMRAIEVLRKLEWSGRKQCEGRGFMGSGGDGLLIPSCPLCGGIEDTPRGRAEFVEEAIGHRVDCELVALLRETVRV